MRCQAVDVMARGRGGAGQVQMISHQEPGTHAGTRKMGISTNTKKSVAYSVFDQCTVSVKQECMPTACRR
jgi:hypothetical protein